MATRRWSRSAGCARDLRSTRASSSSWTRRPSSAAPDARVVGSTQREQERPIRPLDAADEAAHRRIRPGGLVAVHVVRDAPRRLRSTSWRAEAQPLEDGPRQVRADPVMPDEVAVGRRRRLADVVEERRHPGHRRRRLGPRRRRRGCGRARRPGRASPAARRAAPRPRAAPRRAARAARGGAARSTADGRASMRPSSSRSRSPETVATVGASSRIAASVAGSMVRSKRPAKRAARTSRRASSAKRSCGIADGAEHPMAKVAAAAMRVDDAADA